MNSFFISPLKHMVLVLIRSASVRHLINEYHDMFSWRTKKNISTFWLEKASYLELYGK